MFFMIVGCYHTIISVMEGKIMKTVKVLVAASMAAALLAGCGSKTDTDMPLMTASTPWLMPATTVWTSMLPPDAPSRHIIRLPIATTHTP